MLREMTPQEAHDAILLGKAPSPLIVRGNLFFSYAPSERVAHLPKDLEVDEIFIFDASNLRRLPKRLRCRALTIYNGPFAEIPAGVQVSHALKLSGCANLVTLPETLNLHTLEIDHCANFERIPAGMHIQNLKLVKCERFTSLPDGLVLQQLHLENCKEFSTLPLDLVVSESCIIEGSPRLATMPLHMQLRTLILKGCPQLAHLPHDLTVTEHLGLSGNPSIRTLPPGIQLRSLNLSSCTQLTELPEEIQVTRRLDVSGCTSLKSLPASINDLYEVNVADCTALTALPPTLKVHTLNASSCINLPALPDPLQASVLMIAGCARLSTWPSGGIPGLWRLNMRGCQGLRSLPPGNTVFNQLDIGDCPSLTHLPAALSVTNWLDIANTPLSSLPPSASGFKLRWHGVAIPARIALYPETITAHHVLEMLNLEIRRVMIERIGIERLLKEADFKVVHNDKDAGGVRRLLRVELEHDEPLVCLQVQDPSTGRQYLIRVPPTMKTCHQAAAWIAGFDDPKHYHPILET